MTDSPEELAAVEQLLAESDALRGWLARLEQAPSAAPDTVRQRVRRDYQQRLDQITAGLRAHADVIESKLSDDRSEYADLDGRATVSREALAEAELRHAVGEYDRERFETEQRRHSSDLETYHLSLSAVGDRIAKLEQIHALVERPPRALAIEIAPEDVEEVAVVPEVHTLSAADAELVAIADLAPDADQALAIFDEAPPEGDGGAAVAGTVDAPVPETGPLSFRPTGNGVEPARPAAPPARPRPFESAAPLGIPTADAPPRFVRPGERFVAHPPPPAPPSRVPEPSREATSSFSDEIATAGAAPEVTAMPVGRTLRCGECGAMNRPLEWYCEKCGAELTAV